MARQRSSGVAYVLLVFALGCAAEPGGRSGRRTPFPTLTDAVDCTVLPSAPPLVDGESRSEALLAELGAGTARALLRWEREGQESWLLTPETTARLYFVEIDDAGMRWSVQVDLGCDPEATTSVHFTTEVTDQLVTGEFPIGAFGFDVPSLEQGASWPEPAPTEFDGTINVTSASNEHATGFMTGYARTTLRSYVTEEALGIDVELTDLAFRDLRVRE